MFKLFFVCGTVALTSICASISVPYNLVENTSGVVTRVYGNEQTVNSKRLQILDPWTFRFEQNYNDTILGKRWLDENTFLVPNRDKYNGVEHCEITESNGKEIFTITDSRLENNEKIILSIDTSQITKTGSFSGIKIIHKTGDTEIEAYTSHTVEFVNKGSLPNPSNTPQSFDFIDGPRIIIPKTGYCYDSYLNAPEALKNTSGYYIQRKDLVTDLYVLLPFKDPVRLRQLWRNLAGPTDFVSLAALGAWDSRYHRYTQTSAQAEIDTYNYYNLPLDTLVIDTDWRINTSYGYDVNEEYFPDMKTFLNNAKKQNIDICFNDHPEPVESGLNVLASKEVNYRSEKSLSPMLNDGLTYWWYDRNWSTSLVSPNEFDKETWGAYLFHDITRIVNEKKAIEYGDPYPKRAMSLSNVDNISSGNWHGIQNSAYHQFPLTWTGDVNYKGLENEIKNVIRCSINGVPYMSSDLGGHTGDGVASDRLYSRWIQYGAFSPIFRPHCTNLMEVQAQPWHRLHTDANIVNRFRKFINMRYRLLPLFYRLAKENYFTGMPICQPLNMYYPTDSSSNIDTEWMLGHDVLFAPIYNLTQCEKEISTHSIYLPDNDAFWIDVFHGGVYQGGQTVTNIDYTIDETPIFVRIGSIMPIINNAKNTKETNWNNITVDVYPTTDMDNSFSSSNYLYEDDFTTTGYRDGQYRTTNYTYNYDAINKKENIHIDGTIGTFIGDDLSLNRSYNIRYHKFKNCEIEKVFVDGEEASYTIINMDNDSDPFSFSGSDPTCNIVSINLGPSSVREMHDIIVKLK